MHRNIYERNITHNKKTCTHLILLLVLILHKIYYISVSFTPLINKTYIKEERRDEGMKIRSRQTYSHTYHTYVQTCIDTYMNVTSPTTTRHALISSYFYYLLHSMFYISASFTLLINKTCIIQERRDEKMKIRSKQTYSQKHHTYVQTCIDTYMNVTSPTPTRNALISSYYLYLLHNMHYISVSFTLLINKTHITEERRKKGRNEGRN